MLQDCNKILHIQPDIVGHLLEKAMKMQEEEEDNDSESEYIIAEHILEVVMYQPYRVVNKFAYSYSTLQKTRLEQQLVAQS